MTSVLLLQPDNSRQRLVAALKNAGINVFQHSFIQIIPITATPDSLDGYDAVIWISKNAVDYAYQHGLKLTRPTAMYAVGPATAAHAAKMFGQPCQCPVQQHDSEKLLSLPDLQSLQGQRWAIVKGVGGRELLADTLRARGALLSLVTVYKREKKPLSSPHRLNEWVADVDTIVVTSAEQLSYFLAELPLQARSWIQSCHWVTPSERLSQLIPAAAADQITITQSASENAMIKALLNKGTSL
ncbi:uroporphyrinogen-III synthase [Idiomarina seosinensis]|uniref:uroporphyrinogen-III synthase n=1 Tax=Idiomarina seosinensis TaxID=281739 RepID=UPI00384F09F6